MIMGLAMRVLRRRLPALAVLVEDSVHLGVAHVRVLGLEWRRSRASPRKRVVVAAVWEAIVAHGDDAHRGWVHDARANLPVGVL